MKLKADLFVAGRDAYVESVPLVQIVERCNGIAETIERQNDAKLQAEDPRVRHTVKLDNPGDHVMSFVLGVLDGVLHDIRYIKDNLNAKD